MMLRCIGNMSATLRPSGMTVRVLMMCVSNASAMLRPRRESMHSMVAMEYVGDVSVILRPSRTTVCMH